MGRSAYVVSWARAVRNSGSERVHALREHWPRPDFWSNKFARVVVVALDVQRAPNIYVRFSSALRLEHLRKACGSSWLARANAVVSLAAEVV